MNDLFILVSLYTLSTSSCIWTTLLNHKEKRHVLNLIYQHDRFMKKNFKTFLNYKSDNTKLSYGFVLFWIILIFCFISFNYSMLSINVNNIYYNIQIHIPNHVVFLQGFQLFIFLRGIEVRLERVRNCVAEDKKRDIAKSILVIFTIWKKFYKCMGVAFFVICLNMYAIILINLYWMGMMILNVGQSTLFGKSNSKFGANSHFKFPI